MQGHKTMHATTVAHAGKWRLVTLTTKNTEPKILYVVLYLAVDTTYNFTATYNFTINVYQARVCQTKKGAEKLAERFAMPHIMEVEVPE